MKELTFYAPLGAQWTPVACGVGISLAEMLRGDLGEGEAMPIFLVCIVG